MSITNPDVQPLDRDELLDDAAQGHTVTDDTIGTAHGEIDAMGEAAGLVDHEGRPFHGIAQIDRRDIRRWELDPASAEDTKTRA